MEFGSPVEDKDLPNYSNILQSISDLDIFNFYLGCLPKKPISSPLREDSTPSFSLFHSDTYGKTLYKDFATGEVGDCFTFVMKLFKLSRKIDAFNKVAKDFNLTHLRLRDNNVSSFKPFIAPSPKKTLTRDRLDIKIKARKWKIKDKEYWKNKYGIDKSMLEYCDIFPITHYFVNGYCIVADELAYAFAEFKDGIITYKIYQPLSKIKKWVNNNDFSTWELWRQLPDQGNVLILTSSRKDAIVIKSLFPTSVLTSCSLQSENVNPKLSVVEEVKNRFKKVFVLYDNDFNSARNSGRIAGEKLCKSTGFNQIEIPEEYKTKDPSDFVEVHGRKALSQLITRLITKI